MDPVKANHRHMLRSQGPLHPLDITQYLNPSDCYVRSYNASGRYNVNASYNTVCRSCREKRRNLVIEIAAVLGDYSGDWLPFEFRPRNLPLHPLDWSTTFLQFVCNFARQQRASAADQPQRSTPAQLHTDHNELFSAASDGSENLDKIGDADESSGDGSKEEGVEALRKENQRLIDRVQAMSDEVATRLKTLNAETFDMEVEHDQLTTTAMTLLNTRQEIYDLRDRSERLSLALGEEELQAMNNRMQLLVSQQKNALGFS